MNRYEYCLMKIVSTNMGDTAFHELQEIINKLFEGTFTSLSDESVLSIENINITQNGEMTKKTETIPIIERKNSLDMSLVRFSPSEIIFQCKPQNNFNHINEFIKIVHENLSSYVDNLESIGLRRIIKLGWDTDSETGFSSTIKRPEFIQPELLNFSKAGSNLNTRYVPETNYFLNLNTGIQVNAPILPAELMEQGEKIALPKAKVLDGPWVHVDVDVFWKNDSQSENNLQSLFDKIKTHSQNTIDDIIYK